MTWRMTKTTTATLAATLLAGAMLAASPGLASAASSGTTAAVPNRSIGPGLGFSKATPVGETFTLPEGLTLEDPIVAWASENPVDCDEKYSDEGNGSGEEVRVCLIFQNHTRSPITVTLPPGLILVSTNDDVQNGIIVQTTPIVVPPGERYFAPLFAYCVNEDRSTTGMDDRYVLGPVIQHPEFQALFTLLEGKRLTREAAAYVQSAVDDIAQGKGLSAMRSVLQGL